MTIRTPVAMTLQQIQAIENYRATIGAAEPPLADQINSAASVSAAVALAIQSPLVSAPQATAKASRKAARK